MKHRSTLWMLNKCIRISSGLVNQNCIIMSFSYQLVFFFIYTEPLPPGRLDLALSNFSATHLFLKWNPPDGNLTLNYYKIVVDGHQQQTFGNIPDLTCESVQLFVCLSTDGQLYYRCLASHLCALTLSAQHCCPIICINPLS